MKQLKLFLPNRYWEYENHLHYKSDQGSWKNLRLVQVSKVNLNLNAMGKIKTKLYNQPLNSYILVFFVVWIR